MRVWHTNQHPVLNQKIAIMVTSSNSKILSNTCLHFLIVSYSEQLYTSDIFGRVKNFNQTITEVQERTKLIGNLKEMTDEVMVWRQRVLRNEGLTKSGLFVLHYVSNKGPLKLTDCSTSLGVSKPTVTKIVDNLERNGYVERKKEGRDRRSCFVHLTKRGKETIDSMNKQLEDVFQRATVGLKGDEVTKLNSSIDAIRESFRSISQLDLKGE